jgi:hypothetical protein
MKLSEIKAIAAELGATPGQLTKARTKLLAEALVNELKSANENQSLDQGSQVEKHSDQKLDSEVKKKVKIAVVGEQRKRTSPFLQAVERAKKANVSNEAIESIDLMINQLPKEDVPDVSETPLDLFCARVNNSTSPSMFYKDALEFIHKMNNNKKIKVSGQPESNTVKISFEGKSVVYKFI